MKNKAAVNLKIGRFDNVESAVIINLFQFCTALLTLLMMTAKSTLSKRPIVKITVALFFLLQLTFILRVSQNFCGEFSRS